jgi:Carnosine N-methyltransferase
MISNPDLAAVLACPRCDRAPLDMQPAALYCAGCKISFPSLAGMPWLFAEPEAAFAEWRARWSFALRAIEQRIARIERSLADAALLAAARARLEQRKTAEEDHRARLAAVLAPLDAASATASFSTYLALRTRLPPDQGLLTYYANAHRDWAWGDEENAASIELVRSVLGAHAPARTLVLGAGAGRLAYDLHSATSASLTIALDFNPLLMLIGSRVAAGETLQLYEFPLAPRSSPEQAVLRALRAPQTARPGLEWIIADVHRPPFAPKAFDTVVTPWLIDIVPERFETVASRVNQLLAPAGVWINFGSLSFDGADPASQYGLDECREILAASGFDAVQIEARTIPYMCSPASRHGRREEVIAWSAVKDKDSKKQARYEALPDWLVRGQSAIPVTQAIRTQAMSTQVHGFLLSLIDGKRSLKDIARIAAERNLVPPAEAESTIRSFLIKVFDEGRKLGV